MSLQLAECIDSLHLMLCYSDLYVCVYNTDAVAFSGAQFGPGIGPIFLDQLHCSGSESSLLECRYFTPLGLPTCDHSLDAGVRCVGKALKALAKCIKQCKIDGLIPL